MVRPEFNNKGAEFNEIEDVFRSDLEVRIWKDYPLISPANLEVSLRYSRGLIPFCSFDVESSDQKVVRDVLRVALVRAGNPNDLAYCKHATKHKTFSDAIKILIDSINSEDFTLERHVSTQDIRSRLIPESRYILRSNAERSISHPAKAVFLDLQSIAHRKAHPNWHWRSKSRYIQERYGRYSTTRLLSAYLIGES